MLIDALSKDGHNQVLWKNVTEGYLPDLNQGRLAADLTYVVAECSPILGRAEKEVVGQNNRFG